MPWTFSPSAWLCGSYRLSVLCIVAVVFLPFRKTEVIWFDFLPLKHLFAEFPSHKGAVNFFFFKKSLQYHFKLALSEMSGFLTAESEFVQLYLQGMWSEGYTYLLDPAWNGQKHLPGWCQVSRGRQWPPASDPTAALLLFQLLSA